MKKTKISILKILIFKIIFNSFYELMYRYNDPEVFGKITAMVQLIHCIKNEIFHYGFLQ